MPEGEAGKPAAATTRKAMAENGRHIPNITETRGPVCKCAVCPVARDTDKI